MVYKGDHKKLTEEFTLSAIRELKEYKKLLKKEMEEQLDRVNRAKKQQKAIIKRQAIKDNPRASDVVNAEDTVRKEVQRYNALWFANELFKRVKKQHNESIQKIKDDGILVREIQDLESQLTQKKETAKAKKLKLRPKKEKKKNE